VAAGHAVVVARAAVPAINAGNGASLASKCKPRCY